MKNNIFFIIVTYNSSWCIERCISSIIVHEYNPNIIIVDNNSNDSTIEIVKKFANIIIIENTQNFGFGAANNLGINLAMQNGADYVYLLNHDAYLIEPILEELIKYFSLNENVGIISPFHLAECGVYLERQFYKFMYQQGVLNRVYKDLIQNRGRNYYVVDFIPAASWLISIDTIKKVGLFNHNFYHYGEDNNYLHRMAFFNKKVIVTNNVHVVHIGNKVKRNYIRNYVGFHKLVIKAHFLTKFLNINEEITISMMLNDLLKDCKKGVVLFLTLNFTAVLNLSKIIFWKIKILLKVKSERFRQTQKQF